MRMVWRGRVCRRCGRLGVRGFVVLVACGGLLLTLLVWMRLVGGVCLLV